MKKFFGFGSSTPLTPPPTPGSGPSLVGKWKEPKGSDTTEFRADGTVLEKLGSGETIRGRYSLDGAKVKIRLDGVADEISFSAVIKTDALEMKGPDGEVTRYERVK